MVREVALGVYYLHCFDPPVLHLDLKSANVLLDTSGTCKVCDFGMSRVLGEATALLADGITTSRGSVGVTPQDSSLARPSGCVPTSVAQASSCLHHPRLAVSAVVRT